MMNENNKIIVALDYDAASTAWDLVELLGDRADYYKVGLQLLAAAGPEFVRKLVNAKKQVFLDLKSYEIPKSVAGAVDSAGSLGCSMVTVHASGGSRALDAAVKAAQPYPELTVLALTVVSSMSDSDLDEVGVHYTVDEQVLRLATLAVNSGCTGLVSSPAGTKILRQNVPVDTIIVTPGIQLGFSDSTDKAGVASPRKAIDSGASFLVVGSSITQANDPLDAFSKTTLEIS